MYPYIFVFRRNLDYFHNNLKAAVSQTEADDNGGEITVRLPSETIPLVEGKYYNSLLSEIICSLCKGNFILLSDTKNYEIFFEKYWKIIENISIDILFYLEFYIVSFHFF